MAGAFLWLVIGAGEPARGVRLIHRSKEGGLALAVTPSKRYRERLLGSAPK